MAGRSEVVRIIFAIVMLVVTLAVVVFLISEVLK